MTTTVSAAMFPIAKEFEMDRINVRASYSPDLNLKSH